MVKTQNIKLFAVLRSPGSLTRSGVGTIIILLIFLSGGIGNATEVSQELYQRHCQVCHGSKGQGNHADWKKPLAGQKLKYPPPPLDHSAHAWHHSDSVLKKIITDGSRDGRMPPFKGKLTTEEIDAIIHYLHTLWKPEQLQWQQSLKGHKH